MRYYTASRNEESERIFDPYLLHVYRGGQKHSKPSILNCESYGVKAIKNLVNRKNLVQKVKFFYSEESS